VLRRKAHSQLVVANVRKKEEEISEHAHSWIERMNQRVFSLPVYAYGHTYMHTHTHIHMHNDTHIHALYVCIDVHENVDMD